MNQTPATARLRRAVRAVILADDNRVLLCRFSFAHPAVPIGATVVWAAPSGGIEPGELPLAALRRELHEDTGLVIDADPPHVWHQEVAAPGHADGYDGVVNDYFLVRATRFDPRGALSDDELAAERRPRSAVPMTLCYRHGPGMRAHSRRYLAASPDRLRCCPRRTGTAVLLRQYSETRGSDFVRETYERSHGSVNLKFPFRIRERVR